MFSWIYEYPVYYLKKFCQINFITQAQEYFYTAFEHLIFASLGILLFGDRKWLINIPMMDEYEYDQNVYIYYSLYFIRYWSQLKNLDKKQKDYYVMFIHHAMTLLLLIVSCKRYIRIGAIIALSHDLADIPLNLAKGFNKMYEITNDFKYEAISMVLLFDFITVWIATRILLNYNILDYIYHSRNLSFASLEPYFQLEPDEQICIFLLLINFSLQCFWQIMIIKFVYNISIGEKPQDERGESYTFIEEN